MASPPTEAEMIVKVRERLADAEVNANTTSFLPPGNDTRDAAVRELHIAQALAQEWMV